MRHPDLSELEAINIVFIADLVEELTGVLHMVADTLALHRRDEPKLVPLAQVRLVEIVVGTADPDFVRVRLYRRSHFQKDKLSTERCLDTDGVVRVVSLVVDQDVALRVPRTDLVPKDFATAACLVHLCVEETSQLVKSNFAISVQDQHRQKYVLLEVFDQEIVTVPVLLCVEGKNGDTRCAKLCIDQLIDLEGVHKCIGVAHSYHLCHFLDELFDSRVVLRVAFVQRLQVGQREDFLFRVLRLKELLGFFSLLEVKTFVEVWILWIRWQSAQELIDQRWPDSFIIRLSFVFSIDGGKGVPFGQLFNWKPIEGARIGQIVNSSVVDEIIDAYRRDGRLVPVILLLAP